MVIIDKNSTPRSLPLYTYQIAHAAIICHWQTNSGRRTDYLGLRWTIRKNIIICGSFITAYCHATKIVHQRHNWFLKFRWGTTNKNDRRFCQHFHGRNWNQPTEPKWDKAYSMETLYRWRFLLWDTKREDLDKFITQANTYHPKIKFKAEISDTEIAFLYTVIYKGVRFQTESSSKKTLNNSWCKNGV